jgi:hypothetical protein
LPLLKDTQPCVERGDFPLEEVYIYTCRTVLRSTKLVFASFQTLQGLRLNIAIRPWGGIRCSIIAGGFIIVVYPLHDERLNFPPYYLPILTFAG